MVIKNEIYIFTWYRELSKHVSCHSYKKNLHFPRTWCHEVENRTSEIIVDWLMGNILLHIAMVW